MNNKKSTNNNAVECVCWCIGSIGFAIIASGTCIYLKDPKAGKEYMKSIANLLKTASNAVRESTIRIIAEYNPELAANLIKHQTLALPA